IFKLAGLMCTPLLEQDGPGILPQEQRGECLFKGTAEEHVRTDIFLSPPIQVAVLIAAWAGEIATDLGVAVRHQATSEALDFPTEADDSSSHWLAGAKPSRFNRDLPFRVVWVILTTPRSPNSAFSSISSLPSKSG